MEDEKRFKEEFGKYRNLIAEMESWHEIMSQTYAEWSSLKEEADAVKQEWDARLDEIYQKNKEAAEEHANLRDKVAKRQIHLLGEFMEKFL